MKHHTTCQADVGTQHAERKVRGWAAMASNLRYTAPQATQLLLFMITTEKAFISEFFEGPQPNGKI